MKSLTVQEIETLLENIEDLRMRTMCLLGFRHGMRASEICTLKRVDIDLQSGHITVRRLKGSITTIQPLGEDERRYLTHILADRPDALWVFPNASGEPFNRTTFWRWFKDACLLANISPEKAHCHVLKHSLGRALVAANVNMAVVQRALGHKSISSTAVYTELDDETTGKIVQDALKIPKEDGCEQS